MINLAIEAISALIYAVGVVYAIMFLDLRKPFMEPVHYRVLVGAIVFISLVWFAILIGKARRNLKRLREVSKRAAQTDDRPDDSA